MLKTVLDFISFTKKNHFIWGPEPEIYGGSAGLYSYGPNGKLLKNKIENKLREFFISHNYWEIEYPLIVPEVVWKASGHLDRFIDRVFVCSKCRAKIRADSYLEEKAKIDASAFSELQLIQAMKINKLTCPFCKARFLDKVEEVNLMMKTQLGTENAYLRPETATTTYLPFRNYYEFFRKKMPFGVFQIGKAFRNEISPRQNVLRMREFTQAESQLFIFEQEKNSIDGFNEIKNIKLPLWSSELQRKKKKVSEISLADALKKKWIANKAMAMTLNNAYQIAIAAGLPKNKLRFRQHAKEEMAHYAKDAWDLEVRTQTYGWVEIIGNHDRGIYDLKQHSKASGQKLIAEGKTPNIIELAVGIDRVLFCLLDTCYSEEKVRGEVRHVLHFKKDIAPIQAAVFPLVNKDKLPDFARGIYSQLKKALPGFTIVYDSAGSIGKRYRRMDQIGTPFCITIDYDSLKNKDVTVRNRDSMAQKRIKITKLNQFIKDNI